MLGGIRVEIYFYDVIRKAIFTVVESMKEQLCLALKVHATLLNSLV